MKSPYITFAILPTLLASSMSAQVSDVSDDFRCIVVPAAAAMDIDMRRGLLLTAATLMNSQPMLFIKKITDEGMNSHCSSSGLFCKLSS
jgi:hypothetical protein